MRARGPLLAISVLTTTIGLAACTASHTGDIATYQPEPGANIVLSGPIASADGHKLVTGDLVLGPNTDIPAHFHHGEEFLYVIGGSATLSREGEEDIVLRPGDALRIAPQSVHWGRTGPQGLRAVSSWVAIGDNPVRTLVTP